MKKLVATALVTGLLLASTALVPATASASSATSASLKAEYSSKLANLKYSASFTSSLNAVSKTSETKIVSSMNTDRLRAGKASLTRSAALNKVARAWSKKMATSKTFQHNPKLSTQVRAGWQRLGENVAWNGAASDTAATALYYQWMDSDGHRANILNSTYTHVGVGVYVDEDGRHWGTQVFATYPKGKSPDLINPTISGFSKSIYSRPSARTTWKKVKVSHTAKLQKYSGGKWVTQKSLKKGTHNITLKASKSYGASTSYRLYIPAADGRNSAKSKTVKLRTKAKPSVSNFGKVSSVKRGKTITWKKVKLSHTGTLQRYANGKWTKVKSVKAGTRTVTTKAPAAKGKYKFRISVASTTKNISRASKTITVTVK